MYVQSYERKILLVGLEEPINVMKRAIETGDELYAKHVLVLPV